MFFNTESSNEDICIGIAKNVLGFSHHSHALDLFEVQFKESFSLSKILYTEKMMAPHLFLAQLVNDVTSINNFLYHATVEKDSENKAVVLGRAFGSFFGVIENVFGAHSALSHSFLASPHSGQVRTSLHSSIAVMKDSLGIDTQKLVPRLVHHRRQSATKEQVDFFIGLERGCGS